MSIAENGNILALKELNNGNYSHAEVLHGFIKEVLQKTSIELKVIDAVAVSKGPGSYTGLRIGVSAAKGLCFAINKPLISVDTLHSLAHSVSIDEGFIVPMIDARRMEVYSCVYSANFEKVRAIKAEVVTTNLYDEYLNENKVYFLGDGSMKCKEVIKHQNAVFIDDKFPSANQMAELSYLKYKKSDIENVAYFEPFYLKDFIVIPEKKKSF